MICKEFLGLKNTSNSVVSLISYGYMYADFFLNFKLLTRDAETNLDWVLTGEHLLFASHMWSDKGNHLKYLNIGTLLIIVHCD